MEQMNNKAVGLMIYGDVNSTKNALTEEKYKLLADTLTAAGFAVESILYHDEGAARLEEELSRFEVILVWVNPIEQGNDRRHLDELLLKLVDQGVFVSTHPEVILKIGTKKVLYTTRHMDWSADIEQYSDYDDFKNRFLISLGNSKIRILKQYRGNGGNGIFKVSLANTDERSIRVVQATAANEARILSPDDFHQEFRKYFDNEGVLLDQEWIPEISNGMVRCYLTGTKVSGFGYQESNALCPHPEEPESGVRPTSRRFYFSEHCGLFQDLRTMMETKWVPELQKIHSIPDEKMPLLWDADFFIKNVNMRDNEQKYILCEINVSCVSPFPESCIRHIVDKLLSISRK